MSFGANSFTQVGAVNQSWSAGVWYRLEVQWGTNGTVVGNLYNSSGTKLNSVKTIASAWNTSIVSGGIAFRAIGSHNKFWDTVTDRRGSNGLLSPKTPGSVTTIAGPTDDFSPPVILPSPAAAAALANSFSADNQTLAVITQASIFPAQSAALTFFTSAASESFTDHPDLGRGWSGPPSPGDGSSDGSSDDEPDMPADAAGAPQDSHPVAAAQFIAELQPYFAAEELHRVLSARTAAPKAQPAALAAAALLAEQAEADAALAAATSHKLAALPLAGATLALLAGGYLSTRRDKQADTGADKRGQNF